MKSKRNIKTITFKSEKELQLRERNCSLNITSNLKNKLFDFVIVRLNIGKDGKYVIVTKNSVIDENGEN